MKTDVTGLLLSKLSCRIELGKTHVYTSYSMYFMVPQCSCPIHSKPDYRACSRVEQRLHQVSSVDLVLFNFCQCKSRDFLDWIWKSPLC